MRISRIRTAYLPIAAFRLSKSPHREAVCVGKVTPPDTPPLHLGCRVPRLPPPCTSFQLRATASQLQYGPEGLLAVSQTACRWWGSSNAPWPGMTTTFTTLGTTPLPAGSAFGDAVEVAGRRQRPLLLSSRSEARAPPRESNRCKVCGVLSRNQCSGIIGDRCVAQALIVLDLFPRQPLFATLSCTRARAGHPLPFAASSAAQSSHATEIQ